ncbi:transcriptional activator NhaR [Thaumasiovibrio subtropicus]|uniref:transcriptional activator NhaR n=1 Tax=Thaumasiovibrio subtropicus TaxID=1891207 RepID=UPI000B35C5E0|nr:transcriptional activator NhaR [Thaumasiovibrio subtropicus]
MSHLNYNHLYYFWMVCKKGSVSRAAESLFVAPQTVTGQIKVLEQRFNGKLLKRAGRNVEPTELGQLVYKYSDKMFGLSYEMLDIINYSQRENTLFEVGVADALSKRIVSRILGVGMPHDARIHLRCCESTHELLLEQLSQHKLDMILSDCPIGSAQDSGVYSKKLGGSKMSLFSSKRIRVESFPECLEQHDVLIPASQSSMGRQLIQWFEQQGLQPNIIGEFDDVALMKAFAIEHQAMFVAPSLYASEFRRSDEMREVAQIEELTEEYYVIFAERMIQHPAVKRICEADFSNLFES